MFRHQSLHFIGGHRFTGHAGQLRYKQGVVAGDLNGDGRADFHISVHLHAGDDVAALGSSGHVTVRLYSLKRSRLEQEIAAGQVGGVDLDGEIR